MQKLSVAEMLIILEKIDQGRRDASTLNAHLTPLWHSPFLRETLTKLLESHVRGDDLDVELNNFAIVCNWLNPEFAEVLAQIDLDISDLSDIPAAQIWWGSYGRS